MVGHVKKPKAEKNTNEETEVESPTTQFKREYHCDVFIPNSNAFTVVKNPKGGWDILSVEIDSVNLTAGKVTLIGTEESRAGSVEKFKINVVKAGIV